MYKSIKDIPNPYNATEEIKNDKLFIGRDKELNKIIASIDDFLKSGAKKNFLIFGGKSIGKSSFMHILKTKLTSKGLLSVPFIINKNKISSPLAFFKELIDSILDIGSPVNLLNVKNEDENFTQKEIWESLTTYGEHIDSSKAERNIMLAELFAHALNKNQYDIPLSEVNLIKDFKLLCLEVKKLDYKGLVILIDEFQLLSENDSIIQLLQRLMDEVPEILFIMSGNNLLKSDSFDKIIRKSEAISLNLFQTHLIRDFIYKPIMYYGFTREEINEILDQDSFSYFFRKKEHNPYYLNLILHFVFDKYKSSLSDKLRLDSDITSEVINQLKLNSPHHERIAAQLNASSREQLEALTRLFPFQNINLHEIVLINLAFKNYDNAIYQNELKKILNDICSIIPLKLFDFIVPPSISLNSLVDEDLISKNIAAEIKYNFIGDNIDELYMSHIIQSSLNEDLILDTHLNVLDHFSFKLEEFIRARISKLDFLDEKEIAIGKITIAEKLEEVNLSSKLITEKIEQLETTSAKEKISDQDYKIIQNATQDTSLMILPLFAQILGNNKTLYYSFVKAKIRHKTINYENFFFCKNDIKDFAPFYPGDSIIDDTFESYNIEIIDSIILKIKPQVIIFLQTIDTLDLDVMLLRSLINNDFSKTIEILEIKKNFDEDKNGSTNNIGFAYLSDEQFELAEKYFEKVNNKEYVTYLNQAYLEYRLGGNQIDKFLKKAEKSYKQLNPETSLKVIHQILLPIDERTKLPKNFDLAYDVNPDVVVQGNRAILPSFNNQNYGFSFLNKIKANSDLDKFYKTRYTYYLNYNLGEIEKALELLRDAEEKKYESAFSHQIEEQISLDKTIIHGVK